MIKYQAQFGFQRHLATLQQFFSLPSLPFLFSGLRDPPLKPWKSMFLFGSNMTPTDSSVSILSPQPMSLFVEVTECLEDGTLPQKVGQRELGLECQILAPVLPEFSLIFDPLRHKLSNGVPSSKPNCSICPDCPAILVAADYLYKLQVTTNLFHHKLLLSYMRFFTVLS